MPPAEKRNVIDNALYTEPKDDGDRAKSYQVTLPKHWCRKHNWPMGVYMSEQPDGSLRIEAVRE